MKASLVKPHGPDNRYIQNHPLCFTGEKGNFPDFQRKNNSKLKELTSRTNKGISAEVSTKK